MNLQGLGRHGDRPVRWSWASTATAGRCCPDRTIADEPNSAGRWLPVGRSTCGCILLQDEKERLFLVTLARFETFHSDKIFRLNVRLVAKLWRLRADAARQSWSIRDGNFFFVLNETLLDGSSSTLQLSSRWKSTAHVTQQPIGVNDFRQFAIVGSVASRCTQKS